MRNLWTPGPWPYEYTGDGKRIMVGAGLVEGPNGYEVAEVYSDDCDPAEAEANARLIAAAPEMAEALATAERYMVAFYRALSRNIGEENAFADTDPMVKNIRALLARIRGDAP